MGNRSVFLMIIVILAIFLSSIVSVSAQEIDVDSMDNAQLTELLLQILNKLRQEEDPEAVPSAAAAAADPYAEPEPIEEVIQITVYDNKKLIIESLPGYLFIQPLQEEPVTDGTDTGGSEPAPVPGTVCDPQFPNFCFWTQTGSDVVCICSELG